MSSRQSIELRTFHLVHDYSPWAKPENADYGRYYREAVIVVDANALLDLYRVSESTRNEILGIFQDVESRLWIPHQVALEFNRNRKDAVYDRNKAFANQRDVLRKAELEAIGSLDRALSTFAKFREKNYSSREWSRADAGLDLAGLKAKLEGLVQPALSELADLEEGIGIGAEDLSADPVLERLARIFLGRIGSRYSDKELRGHVEHAVSFRYPNRVPPGFSDVARKSTDLNRAGDYLVWRQLLDHVLTSQGQVQSVLLVTSDVKDDWWVLDSQKKPICPHPELLQEMREECRCSIQIVTLTKFLEGMREYIDIAVSDAAISEVQEQEDRDFMIFDRNSSLDDLAAIRADWLPFVARTILGKLGYEESPLPFSATSGIDLVMEDPNGNAVGFALAASQKEIKQAAHALSRVGGRLLGIDAVAIFTQLIASPALFHVLADTKVQVFDGRALQNLIKAEDLIFAIPEGL